MRYTCTKIQDWSFVKCGNVCTGNVGRIQACFQGYLPKIHTQEQTLIRNIYDTPRRRENIVVNGDKAVMLREKG